MTTPKTLTKCIYGFETDPKKTPFGLLNNQVRVDNIIQSAGWFNIEGERMGQGDLSIKEMKHIAKNLPPTEAFFILTEGDSIWDMPSSLDRMAPGFKYVVDKAAWAIIPSVKGAVIIRIRDDIKDREDAERDGVKFVRITRDAFRKALTAATKPAVKKVAKENEEKDAPVDSSISALKKQLLAYYAAQGIPVPTTGSTGSKSIFGTKPKTTTPIGKVPAAPATASKPKSTTMPALPTTLPPIALPGLLPKKKKAKTASP